jgi:hypothetical protein
MSKIDDAQKIIIDLGMPRAQQNERTALCILALVDIQEKDSWETAKNPLIGITPIMEFAFNQYHKKYAPNSRETFRRFSMHQLVEAGIAKYNPDDPSRPVNSPKAVYQISDEALSVIRKFKQYDYAETIQIFMKGGKTLSAKYAAEREQLMIPVKTKNGGEIRLSPGEHNELIKAIIEDFGPRYIPGSELVYIGDTGEKWGYYDIELAGKIGLEMDHHGKMPDVILYDKNKKWLVLIESVTSHGPIDGKRIIELKKLFAGIKQSLIFVTAFPSRAYLNRYLNDIAWESEVWLADNPSHMIHFNGSKFLGPYYQ